MDSSALLAHILSQTRQNVEFLVSHKQISAADGRDILNKLPNAFDRSIAALEQQTQNLLITPPSSTAPSYNAPQTVQARALWAWNEGRDSNDLTFRAGDTIEIVTETNPDWWTGRHNGKQGLFPSNYVEKLPLSGSSSNYHAPPPRDSYSAGNSSMPSFPNQSSYQPSSGPYPPQGPPPGPYSGAGYQPPPNNGYQPTYAPPPGPPQGGQFNSYGPPPPLMEKPAPQAPSSYTTTAAPQQPPKKSKFGGLGNTLAQSAVGGVGFGAGSAVGSGIVNAIF